MPVCIASLCMSIRRPSSASPRPKPASRGGRRSKCGAPAAATPLAARGEPRVSPGAARCIAGRMSRGLSPGAARIVRAEEDANDETVEARAYRDRRRPGLAGVRRFSAGGLGGPVGGVRAHHRRDAPRPGPRGLADGVPHLRLPGLQPPRRDRPRQRRRAPPRVDAGDGRGGPGDPAAGLRRRDVHRPARLRPSAGARRDDRGPDLGLPARAAGRHPRVRAVRGPHAQPRPLRQPRLSPDRGRPHHRRRRPHRRARLGVADGRLPRRHHPLVGRDDRQRHGGQRADVQPRQPRRPLLRRRPRRRRRSRALADLHRGGRRRPRRRHVGHGADGRPRARLAVGACPAASTPS